MTIDRYYQWLEMKWWSVIAAWRLLDQLPLGLDQTSSQLFSTQHVHKEFSIDWEMVDSQLGSQWSASKKLKSPESQGEKINDLYESVWLSQRSSFILSSSVHLYCKKISIYLRYILCNQFEKIIWTFIIYIHTYIYFAVAIHCYFYQLCMISHKKNMYLHKANVNCN